jgi:hypothetical protein
MLILLTEMSAWHRVALNYDVRRMSRRGLCDLARSLYAAGAIGMQNFRLLSLEPVTYASHWPSWTVFETPEDCDGCRDWIDEIQTRIRKGYPDHDYVAYQQVLLSFLERVETARPARTKPAEKTLIHSGQSPQWRPWV